MSQPVFQTLLRFLLLPGKAEGAGHGKGDRTSKKPGQNGASAAGGQKPATSSTAVGMTGQLNPSQQHQQNPQQQHPPHPSQQQQQHFAQAASDASIAQAPQHDVGTTGGKLPALDTTDSALLSKDVAHADLLNGLSPLGAGLPPIGGASLGLNNVATSAAASNPHHAPLMAAAPILGGVLDSMRSTNMQLPGHVQHQLGSVTGGGGGKFPPSSHAGGSLGMPTSTTPQMQSSSDVAQTGAQLQAQQRIPMGSMGPNLSAHQLGLDMSAFMGLDPLAFGKDPFGQKNLMEQLGQFKSGDLAALGLPSHHQMLHPDSGTTTSDFGSSLALGSQQSQMHQQHAVAPGASTGMGGPPSALAMQNQLQSESSKLRNYGSWSSLVTGNSNSGNNPQSQTNLNPHAMSNSFQQFKKQAKEKADKQRMLDEAKERKEQAERNKQMASGGVAMSGGGGVMASGAMNPLNPQLATLNKDHLQAGFLNSHSPHSMHSFHGPSSDNSGGSGSNSPAHMRTPNAGVQSEADREKQRRREQERRRREVKSGQIDMNEQNNIMTTFEEMID
ncbi:uncharacterized protein LOC108864245 [Galendromus occidentalis]|uniref:Uncharacterized protein LOC108864245 n=1 Tax=Galendromus occidentalis TaxID=34638 RepID=A0AAJ7L603_9ACAR|nr:uncharacterized protein LOC108864245 [Galendromus occidentalis]